VAATYDLATNVGNMITMWSAAVAVYNKNLFNGSPASIALLHTLISPGKVLQAGFGIDEGNTTLLIERAIYGNLIPRAWARSNEDLNPFILNSELPCSTQDPFKSHLDPAVGKSNSVCYNGMLYYLLQVSGKYRPCVSQKHCKHGKFTALPGAKTLDGSQWGGISKDDFVVGYVLTIGPPSNPLLAILEACNPRSKFLSH